MNEEAAEMISEEEPTRGLYWGREIGDLFSERDIPLNWVYDNRDFDISVSHNWFNSLPCISSLSYSSLYNVEPEMGAFSYDGENPIKFARFKKNSYYYHKRVHAVFTFGKSNYMLGFISCDGEMWVFRKNLSILHDYLMDEYHKDFPTNRFNDTYIMGMLTSMADSSNHIIDSYKLIPKNNPLNHRDLVVSLLARISSGIASKDRTFRGGRVEKISPQWILDSIDEKLKSILNTSDINSIHRNVLLDKTTIYKRALFKLQHEVKSAGDQAFQRGMSIGTKVYSGLIKAGYIPQEDGKMIKECWIRPEICIYGDKYYRIHEKDQKYALSDIVFNPSSLSSSDLKLNLNAIGDHPNVSSGANICMGDENQNIYRKFLEKRNTNYTELVDLLLEVEKTLEVINYDSSFYSPHNGMKDRMIPIDVNPEDLRHKKKEKEVRRI